ncbi:MAG: hypothetical protein ABIZ04_24615 [Opitutus sp.]
MILDDSDSHDLNQVAKGMFSVGVPQFDRVLPKQGVVIATDDPRGKVILQTLKVMEGDDKSGTPAQN